MDDLELLFFDTFSHESSEEINLDLVQFPKPVFIGEVRIIPLGARVQADFPGGVRLGATNPSQFKIEFFVNDLSKPGASTFESLGAIDYNQNGNIHLECSHIQQIPTDGLVLRGWYSTITLAVYGALTKSVVSAVEAVGASSGVGAGAPGVGQDPRPPPAAPGGPGIATAKWVQQHAQVSAEPERSEHGGYSVEGATPHYSAYPPPPPPQQQQHQATSQNYQDYNRHAGYQWPQGCHTEGYDGNKDGYEEEGWDMRTEDKHWERTGKDSRHGPQDPQNFRTLHEEQSPEYHERGTPEYDSGLRRGSGGGRGGDYYSGASQWENTGGGGGGGGGAWVSSPHHHHSRKRPRTPPHPAIATSPHKSDRSASVKREGSPPVPYESLSPGDVESISEGDIPETEIGEEGGAKTPPIEDEIVGGVEGGPGGTPPHQGSAAPVIPPSPPQPPPPAPHHDEPSLDAEQFEPILSDDDIGDDADHQDMDYDFNDYTDDPLKTFNPYSCEIPPLMSLGDPSISPAEWEERKALRGRSGGTKEGQEDLAALLSGVEQPTDNREHWLESAEQAIACLPKTLPYMSNKEDVLKKLMEWVVFGLDFDEALNQVQLGLKIRHIKAGIRLVETLANCGEVIAEQAIVETDAQNRLIEMYHRDYMALSIKLMILRSLDATLRYKSCVERFLERGKKGGTSGYQKLIEMVRGSQLARVKYAISALLQKLHLYEILTKIGGKVRESLVNPPKMEEGAVESVDFDLMTMSLEEVLKIYVEAPYTMSQPKRFMPVSSQFEIPDCSSYSNPYGAIFTYFRSTGILHSCINMLVHPATSCCPSIVAPIHELIAELLETDGGMKFLATSLETNQLIRILIGNQDESDLGNPGTNLTLGMHLAYRLQALSYIDTLDDMPPGDDDPDKLEILDALQGLFCLTLSNFGNIGKAAVVHVLSRGDNFSVLLRYFKQKSSLRRRSPARSYIADLLIMAVKHSDHVPFLHKYGSQLLDLLADAPELSELQKWLRPVDSPAAFSYDNISPVVEHLKNSIENCTSLPGEMVTAVRVLRYLGIPSHESDLAPNTFLSEYRQLKYKCVVLQLFSLDGLGHLLSILQKLCEYYEQPALHSARLAGRHGLALLAFIRPAVQLVRRMLTYVISCRNTDFKDLTAVPILLQTYTLMSTIPINAQAHNDAQRVCRELGETLLAYTQPVSSETCTESEALNKSLWTLMVAEVLKFTTDLPANFIVGLSVLSEMLPLPLPLQTRAPISEEEVSRAVNSRKLWSAHLHSLSHVVADTIVAMSGSSYRPLLELLRRVCIQLADLAAPTALVVTRALVDSICDALPSEGPSSTHLLRLLNFLACLVAHGPVKSALLFLITKNSGMKNNEKYVSAMQSLINLLKASSQDSAQCQECFLSIVQSLCDAEVSLVPPPGLGVNVTNEMYLANALPAKELLVMMCTSVMEHVATGDHGLSTMLPAMRALLLLTEHDYGFYHLKVCLEKRPGALLPPLEKITSGWNKESSMCLASLSAILELVRSAASLEPPESYPLRTLVSSHAELRSALGWKGGAQSEPEHPLMAIEKHLKANAAEYETLEPLLENVTGLIRLLEEDGQKSNESVVEPVLVSAEPLLGQFAARPVYLVGDGDDVQLSTTFWLAPPSIDDHDPDLDQVGVDLIEVAKAELCDLPLADVVAQVCRHKTTPGDIEHQAPTPAKKRLTEPNTKRPFVAPMRGRGFRGVNNSCGVGSSGGGGSGGGSGNSGSVQRGDVFRSRPPNTSRPPSLHVDDFVALETCGAQPTGPTGYNKLTMRAAQDLIATRTRGGRGSRTFGIDRGGRFYTVAQTYQREAGAWDNQVLSEHGGYTLGHDLRGVEVVGSTGVVGRFCSGGGGRGGGGGGSHRAWQDTSARAIRGASTRHIRFFTR